MARTIPLRSPDHRLDTRSAQTRVTGFVALVNAWHGRWRARRSLHRLPDHLLRDIGLSRDEAQREAVKPFWRG